MYYTVLFVLLLNSLLIKVKSLFLVFDSLALLLTISAWQRSMKNRDSTERGDAVCTQVTLSALPM